MSVFVSNISPSDGDMEEMDEIIRNIAEEWGPISSFIEIPNPDGPAIYHIQYQNQQNGDKFIRDMNGVNNYGYIGTPMVVSNKPPYYVPVVEQGVEVTFVSFQQIAEMLKNNQIERYIIDTLLQPTSLLNSPNRILTMFEKNGSIYLVKARYDQATNQIYPPV